jgi:hypothetical protein
LAISQGLASAQILGVKDAQEKGDIVFRTLFFGFNLPYKGDFHSGIYTQYSEPGTNTGHPENLTYHSVTLLSGEKRQGILRQL